MFVKILKQYLCPCVLIFCLLYLTSGCGNSKSEAAQEAVAQNFLKRIYTQDELDNILQVGMSRQDVTIIFGSPLVATDDLFVYRLNFNQKITTENSEGIIGFSVIFHKNKVARWAPNYTGLNGDKGSRGNDF